MQQTIIDPLILMPEDMIFADIDNKAALVPCDSSGVTTAEQWVEAHVSMYLGNVPQTISAIVCKIYDVVLGPDYTNDPAPSRYFRAEQTPATGYVKVYIKNGTGLTVPTKVIITVTAIIDGESVSRNVAMNICGSLKGIDGIDGNDGNDGDDAERYWIELEGGVKNVKFREDFAGNIRCTPSTARIILKHLVGSEESELAVAPSGYAIEYLADNNEWKLIDTAAGMTRLLESDLSDGAWSPAVYRLRKGSTELMRINVYAEWEYQRMLLPAGIYTSREYTRTPTTTPLVLHESSGEYWFLVADTNKVGNDYIGPKDANQEVWQQANDFDVVLTRMLFAQFAQLGGFIVYDNFFFSRYGTLVDASGNETVVGQANVSLQYAGRVPYGWFSTSDPMASAAPDSGYRFRPSKCINALTGEEWAAGGNIHFSPRGDISVKGALMASKLSRENLLTTSGGTYHYLNPYTVNAGKKTVSLNGNYIVAVGKDFNSDDDCEIFLPTARLVEGMELTILFAGFEETKHRIPFKLKVARRLVDSEDDEQFFDTDAAIEIYNTDYVTTNGFCLMCDSPLDERNDPMVIEEGEYRGNYLSCAAGVSMIKMVAATHPWSVWTSGTNAERSICWAIVDIKTIA